MLGRATFAMVVSSTCITVASMMQIVMSGRFRLGSESCGSSAMSVRRHGPGGVRMRAATGSERTQSHAEERGATGVDTHMRAHPCAKLRKIARRGKRDPDRNALDDLYPVACRVLGGKQRKLRAR